MKIAFNGVQSTSLSSFSIDYPSTGDNTSENIRASLDSPDNNSLGFVLPELKINEEKEKVYLTQNDQRALKKALYKSAKLIP